MSKKAPSSTKSSSKITKISAKDTKPTVDKSKKVDEKAIKPARSAGEKPVKDKKRSKLGGYFRGAWSELRLVRWPDRTTTWKMTGTLILFCLFFVALILSIDLFFQYLFNQMIG